MRLLLGLIRWGASLVAALVGVVIGLSSASNIYFAPAALAAFAFAVAVNPLAARRPKPLHGARRVVGIALGSILVGVASLYAGLTRTSDTDAEQAALEELVGLNAVAPQASDLKLWVLARHPMDDATFERVKIIATTPLDPKKNPEALRRYQTAQMELENDPSNTPEWIRFEVNQFVEHAALDDKLQAALAQISSATPRMRAAIFLRQMEDKAKLEKLLAETK